MPGGTQFMFNVTVGNIAKQTQHSTNDYLEGFHSLSHCPNGTSYFDHLPTNTSRVFVFFPSGNITYVAADMSGLVAETLLFLPCPSSVFPLESGLCVRNGRSLKITMNKA